MSMSSVHLESLLNLSSYVFALACFPSRQWFRELASGHIACLTM